MCATVCVCVRDTGSDPWNRIRHTPVCARALLCDLDDAVSEIHKKKNVFARRSKSSGRRMRGGL